MKQGKLINIFKKEDGAGLVLALMVLMVLAVLGVAVAGVTIGSYKLGNISRDSNSAYYIAEAGANLAYEDIKNGVMPAYETSANSELNYFTQITQMVRTVNGKTYEKNFSDQFGDKPKATIKIEPAPAYNVKEYTIVSTGEINGISRTVRKPFTVNWVNKNSGIGLPPLPDDCVLYIGDEISFGPFSYLRATVWGDIKTNPSFKGIFYNSNKIVHMTTDGVTPNTIDNSTNLDMEPYRKIKFPELPGTEGYDSYSIVNSRDISPISKSSYIKTLTVGTVTGYLSSPLTIDTGNEGATINLVVDNLKVYNNINITGNGTVNLYVTGSMEFKTIFSGITVGNGHVEQLNILYSGTQEVKFLKYGLVFGDNINFTGTIFSQRAAMGFYNNVKLEGIIVTFGNSLKLDYNVNVTAVIYAPDSEVTMYGGSKLNGGLVANDVNFYGGLLTDPNEVRYSALDEYVKQYLFGTGTGETPTLDKLIFTQAAVEP